MLNVISAIAIGISNIMHPLSLGLVRYPFALLR